MSEEINYAAWVTLVLVLSESYLRANKLWSRKHMQDVAESVSLMAQGVGLLTLGSFALASYIDGSITGIVSSVVWFSMTVFMILVGTGVWLSNTRDLSFWQKIKKFVNKEKSEVGDLVKGFYAPAGKDFLVQIVQKIALIDNKISTSEKEILTKVFNEWDEEFDMDALMALAEKHRLFVIEDVAQAQGARYHGRRVGTIGRAGCFSFFPSKNLGTFGDGGAMASADQELVGKVRMLANHGRFDKFTHQTAGTNSRLDTMKAAQLSICLKALDSWNKDRRRAADLYKELLSPYAEISCPQVPDNCEPIWHLLVIRHAQRDELRQYLQEEGIQTGLHYPKPLHLQPAYDSLGLGRGSFPEAEKATDEILSLPMFPFITEAEIQAVVDAIGRFLVRKK